MSLPLLNSPQLLSPDDVFGFRLANRRIERLGDTTLCIGEEHRLGETDAGEHNSTQIARSIFVFRMPHYDTLSDYYGYTLSGDNEFNAPLRAMGPAQGWKIPPVLRSTSLSTGSSAEQVYYIDALPQFPLFGCSVSTVFDDVPTWTKQELWAVSPRRTFEMMDNGTSGPRGLGGVRLPGQEKGVRIYLGSWDSIRYLIGGTIVCNTRVEKE